ncbi:MAG: hypothetical protein Q7S11_03015 [bacterium]|nr:hypothetical protein [bacterium]
MEILSSIFLKFVLDNTLVSFVSSFFIVAGGAVPIAILIYLFSKKEKKILLGHAEAIEKTMPLQEELLKKMAEVIGKSINPQNFNENIDNFNKYIEAQNTVEENKKFIKYAKDYNFISAVGHVLRASNYIPRGIKEHQEYSKNSPV